VKHNHSPPKAGQPPAGHLFRLHNKLTVTVTVTVNSVHYAQRDAGRVVARHRKYERNRRLRDCPPAVGTVKTVDNSGKDTLILMNLLAQPGEYPGVFVTHAPGLGTSGSLKGFRERQVCLPMETNSEAAPFSIVKTPMTLHRTVADKG
jgi:hypothetical protein